MTDGTRFFGFFLAILLFQIIGGLLPRNSFAQEGYSDPHSHCELQQPPELYSVSFTGFSGATGITLIKPETGETITAPEWLDANLNGNTNDPGDKNDTAAEPMQTAFLVRVAFNFANTAVNPGCVHVWAQGTFGGLASQSSPVTVGSDGTAILQVNSPSQTVDFEGNASWTFMCMIGSDTSVQTIGTSTHVICVPHGVTQSCYPYDLVMIASCQSCQGLGTTPRQVADAVYNGLAANAKNRAGTLMTYALNAPGDDGSIAKLVQNHAGSCESWARYFQDQYKAQGLAGAANAVKIAGWQLQDETVAVNHAGDSIWMGLAVALAGNNNQAAVVNGGATDLGVAGGGYVNAGKYCQGANKGTNSGDTAIFANGTIQWMVADHAVCLLQDGNDLVLYDTSWGGRSAANTGYVLANTAMPTAGTTSNYIKTDQFVSVYFLNVFDYIEGTIQLVNPVSESSELVPASNFDNNGAAPNTLNVVWLAIK